MENYGGVFLKARRVGATYAQQSMDYYNEMTSEAVMHSYTRVTFPSLWFERGVYDLTGTRKIIDSASYQKHYNRIEELEPEEQVYLKEGRMLSMEGPRRSGRTTRILENAIEELIRDGRTILMDHDPRGHEYLWNNLRRRLATEHPEIEYDFEFNQKERPKIIFITNA